MMESAEEVWYWLVLFIFFLPFFFFFFSFSTPLLEPDRVLVLPSPWRTRTGHWSTWLLSRANYYHGMQSLATPSASSHLLPLLFSFLFFFSFRYLHTYMGSFRVLLVESPLRPWYPIWIARQMASRVVRPFLSSLLASNQLATDAGHFGILSAIKSLSFSVCCCSRCLLTSSLREPILRRQCGKENRNKIK